MSLIDELQSWATSRPIWQRLAIERVLANQDLSDADLEDFLELCVNPDSAVHAADPDAGSAPPGAAPSTDPVSLRSISDIRGIDQLAAEPGFEFARTGLTVVYGRNGSGKSGFVRILKVAGIAKYVDDLIGDVFGDGSADQHAVLKYDLGGITHSWTLYPGAEPPSAFRQIVVYDNSCASVYVEQDNEVQYRPFGLDVFDKLVSACDELAAKVDAEVSRLPSLPNDPGLIGQHRVGQLVAQLSAETPDSAVRQLGEFTTDDAVRLGSLSRNLASLEVNTPVERAKKMRQSASIIDQILDSATSIGSVVDDAAFDRIGGLVRSRDRLAVASGLAAEQTLGDAPLPGTGDSPWRALWEAARSYSAEAAYPDYPYPNTEEEALCVLCQQPLRDAARERLRHFENHVQDTVQQQLAVADQELATALEALPNSPPDVEDAIALITELHPDAAEVADLVQIFVGAAGIRLEALRDGDHGDTRLELPDLHVARERALAEQIRGEADELERSESYPQLEATRHEVEDLRARQCLAENLGSVLAYLAGLRRADALNKAKGLLKTAPITRKNNELAERFVTGRLKKDFREQLDGLGYSHLRLTSTTKGRKGLHYHRIELDGASIGSTRRVLSEGELNAVALAAFFAEAASAPVAGPLVLDDPVSSFDHDNRQRVSGELVRIAERRQVIVFTHDLAFIAHLSADADSTDLEVHAIQIDVSEVGTGVSSDDNPWIAQGLGRRVKHLRARVDEMSRLWEEDRASYDSQLRGLYVGIRSAWERLVEECLFNDTVRRFSHDVATKRLNKVDAVTREDCRRVSKGMRSCNWLLHDQADADSPGPPTATVLKQDFQMLYDFWSELKPRRN